MGGQLILRGTHDPRTSCPRGTCGSRTSCPGGQLVLGPRVRGGGGGGQFKEGTSHPMTPPGHILTNLIISRLLNGNADRKWGKSPSIRTVND